MAACRTPAGDNRCSTRGPFGLSSSESASRTIIAVRRATPSRHKERRRLVGAARLLTGAGRSLRSEAAPRRPANQLNKAAPGLPTRFFISSASYSLLCFRRSAFASAVSPVCSRLTRRCSRAFSNRFAFAFWDSATVSTLIGRWDIPTLRRPGEPRYPCSECLVGGVLLRGKTGSGARHRAQCRVDEQRKRSPRLLLLDERSRLRLVA